MPSSSSSIPKPSFRKGETINDSWEVIRELGSGGCGVVYEVRKLEGNSVGTRAAMKAETVDPQHKHSETLMAEATVLRKMQHSPHFCTLYLAGRYTPDCNIVIMSLVGRSLSWLRRQNPSQRFSLSTALRLGTQCLQAIEDLHNIGFIHRDVKGSNFAMGTGSTSRVVHMIDFGFARYYLVDKGDGGVIHRPARKRAPYLGTDRYCSLHVHRHQDQGRRDDLWSFLYMLIEFVVGQVPWRNSSYKKLARKKSLGGEYLLRDCPLGFFAVYDHIRLLGYSDRPNYDRIRNAINDICEAKKYKEYDPFDWEEGGRYRREYLTAMEELENKMKKQEEDNEGGNEEEGVSAGGETLPDATSCKISGENKTWLSSETDISTTDLFSSELSSFETTSSNVSNISGVDPNLCFKAGLNRDR